MTELERAILHIKTRADVWAVKEIEDALEQEPCDKCEVGNPCLYCKHDFEEKGKLVSKKQIDTDDDVVVVSMTDIKCDDAISREDKKHIDGFKYWCETNEENGTITIPKFVCDEIVKILDKLPSVQPSQKEQEIKYWIDYYGHVTPIVQPSHKGHWIEYGKLWKCSECEDLSCCHENYCNHCGAEMESEE